MVRPAMSGEGRQPDRQPDDWDHQTDHQGFTNAAWSIPSYLLSGMAVYGGIGWLLDRWLGTSALLPIGILVGLGLALYLVYHRYGR
ncbi:Putative F0F1-ATPase subunit Ca2+/Mg2+ transporter [Thermomonospora echinospora]|uniref:Putative F0F1-ATPase subunit Ca2+/Mg2+ transporter n=2 Tax=Thermomonospora echinospora TaxID=1992 RepID=A0A1H5VZ76_9ACTN|nr:Putative F0F1-ATPase subunit Ca2+/Mg2+ transporter [Thermomonospora echinospora]